MEFYQVHARCRGAETVSDQGLVYASLKECLRRCRCEGEAAALHQTGPDPAKCLAAPGITGLPGHFQYHPDPGSPGSHQTGHPSCCTECPPISATECRQQVLSV